MGIKKTYRNKQVDKIDEKASLLNPESRDFVYDEVDDFEDDRDRSALSTAKRLMAKGKESHEQVLGIDVSSSEDEDDSDDGEVSEENDDVDHHHKEESDEDDLFMEDDIADEPEFKLPDERAWGKNKWRYIGTDTSDETILRKLRRQDEEYAKLEEETARKLQERMAAELQDFAADDLIPQEEDSGKLDEGTTDSVVEMDLSRLSQAKRLELLQRESPEFIPLIADLQEKCEDLRSFLAPLMEGVRMGQVTSRPICQYITTKYRLVINYVCVLNVYMVTKCQQGTMNDHPIIIRLSQYRQLLEELVPCDDKLRTYLENLIPTIVAAKAAEDTSQAAPEKKPGKRKKLQLLSKKDVTKVAKKTKLSDLLEGSDLSDDEHHVIKREVENKVAEASSDEEHKVNEPAEVEENDLDPEGRRPISYQITKNKGLLPSRSKEQRNPRVRYRKKYQTKLKKRKGQVREVRKEMNRYEGEVSGIRSHTIKSIRIK